MTQSTDTGIEQIEPTTPASAASTGLSAVKRDWMIFALIVLLGWSLPLMAGGFYLYLGLTIAIYAMASLGLQLMVGLAGQLSLGHAAFVGIGAYTTVILEKQAGFAFVPAALCAMLLAGLMGLLMAQLIRLSGVYFKIATFGFGVIVYQIISNTTWLTGGHVGIRGIPGISIFGWAVTSRTDLFILEMSMFTIVYALLLRLCHGRIGRAFAAIGQNESAACSIGIPTDAYRMAVITIGCAVAGLAGSLLPHLMRFLSPESFGWHESLVLLIMITVGGLGSLPGAIIGTLVVIVVPEYLRELAQYKMFVYGLLLVMCMMFLPNGLAGLIQTVADRVSRLRRRKP